MGCLMWVQRIIHDDVIKWNHFPRYWPFVWGESTDHGRLPLAKASDAELWCFLWPAPEQTNEQTLVTPVIWEPLRPLWRHCNAIFCRNQCIVLNFMFCWNFSLPQPTVYSMDHCIVWLSFVLSVGHNPSLVVHDIHLAIEFRVALLMDTTVIWSLIMVHVYHQTQTPTQTKFIQHKYRYHIRFT